MIIGYIAGALTTIAFAPQLQKALITKSTTDVSLIMLLCSTSGMALWLIYGFQINDPAIIVANSISVVLASSLLRFKIKNDYADSSNKPALPYMTSRELFNVKVCDALLKIMLVMSPFLLSCTDFNLFKTMSAFQNVG